MRLAVVCIIVSALAELACSHRTRKLGKYCSNVSKYSIFFLLQKMIAYCRFVCNVGYDYFSLSSFLFIFLSRPTVCYSIVVLCLGLSSFVSVLGVRSTLCIFLSSVSMLFCFCVDKFIHSFIHSFMHISPTEGRQCRMRKVR